MARTTILDLFVENAEQHGSKVAALVKLNGRYEERTWKQLYDDAMSAAAGLIRRCAWPATCPRTAACR